MAACTFNIFIIFTIYLGFVLFPSHGVEVIQPQSRTANEDGVASIRCEYNASDGSVLDVRLNKVSLTDESVRSLLCQRGMNKCENIFMYPEEDNKYLFIILNIMEEAMNVYECEFTVIINDLEETKRGTPTRLLRGQMKTEEVDVPHPPTPAQSNLLCWILIGLLALMSMYSCVITSFYIRLRISSDDPENSTYVEMRKGPLPRNQIYDPYCG